MIGRLMRSADFERVLGVRMCFSSEHFAAHHLADVPSSAKQLSASQGKSLPVGQNFFDATFPRKPPRMTAEMTAEMAAEMTAEMSPEVGQQMRRETPVRKLQVSPTLPQMQADSVALPSSAERSALPNRVWLGTVVPKRHARRAVTRTLLKRQMRSAVAGHSDLMPSGIWVLRLRAPFDRNQFRSAASDAIRRVVRSELDELLTGAIARPTAPSNRPRRR